MTTLLLHGFLGRGHAWWDFCERDSSCIAPDLVGHGPLPPTTTSTQFGSYCESLWERFADAEVLVGYSMGARVALGMMAQHPDRARAAILIGANPGLRTDTERLSRQELEATWRKQLLEDGLESFVDAWEQQPLFESQAEVPSADYERQRAWRTSHLREGIALSIDTLGLGTMPSLWDTLAQIASRTLLLTGSGDAKFCELASQMAACMPNAAHAVVDGAGHNPLLEQPLRAQHAMNRFLDCATFRPA